MLDIDFTKTISYCEYDDKTLIVFVMKSKPSQSQIESCKLFLSNIRDVKLTDKELKLVLDSLDKFSISASVYDFVDLWNHQSVL